MSMVVNRKGHALPLVARITRLQRTRSALAERQGNLGRPGSSLFLLALSGGVFVGLCELALGEGRRRFVTPEALGAIHLNPHAWWMVPLADALLFGLIGIIFETLAVVSGKSWTRSLGIFCLCGSGAYTLLLAYRGLSNVAYAALAVGAALQLAPIFTRIARRGGRLYRVIVLAPAMAAAAWFGIAGLNARQHHPAAKGVAPVSATSPNVLFIVLDTVRAESLSLYGRERPTSVELEKLAQTGVRFDQARTPAAWTLPAHASMFTGRWPYELSARLDRPLDDEAPTLAEYLASRGYATAGFFANPMFGSPYFGLDRGFEHYESNATGPVEFLRSSMFGRVLLQSLVPSLIARDRPTAFFLRKDAAQINQHLLDWLDDRPAGRPFFAFVNYYDAHDPYIPPPGAQAGFAQATADENELNQLREWHRLNKSELATSVLERVRDRYEECISALDRRLGELFDALAKRGLLDNTIVVVTSDHGEHFGEHGQFEHGRSLHSQVMRVPLVISGRVPCGSVVAEPASLAELPATIVELAGVAEDAPFPGRSLARFWDPSAGEPAQSDAMLLSETVDDEDSSQPAPNPPRSLISEGMVYMRERDGTERLFALSDEREEHDLAQQAETLPNLERFRAAMRSIDARAEKEDQVGGG